VELNFAIAIEDDVAVGAGKCECSPEFFAGSSHWSDALWYENAGSCGPFLLLKNVPGDTI
jgi:hypothetical protein